VPISSVKIMLMTMVNYVKNLLIYMLKLTFNSKMEHQLMELSGLELDKFMNYLRA